MTRGFIVRPLAEADAEDAARWYEDERAGLAERFLSDVDRTFARIRERPFQFPTVSGEVRRALLHIRKIIDAIKDGFAGPELKAEMDELQTRKESLLAKLATADAPVPLLHPNLAALYREKVATLASALENAESRSEAAEALRDLVDAIILSQPATSSESN
jgi:plasmid stabilization system protein ParE